MSVLLDDLVSSDALSELEKLYGWTESIHEARYAIAAMCALQLCEWFSLLEDEIQLVHKRGISKVNILYLACRYYPAAIWIIVMWTIVGDHSSDFCLRVAKPVNAFLAPCQLLAQGVMVARAYGFSQGNRHVLIFLSTCYLIFIGVNIWVFCVHILIPLEAYTIFKKTGCFVDYGEGSMAFKIGYSILSSTIMDFLSLVVAIVYCFKHGGQEVSLYRYFMRQGVASFALIFAANIISFSIYMHSPGYQSGLGLPIILILPNLIACRVLLQLRKRYNPEEARIHEENNRRARRALTAAGLVP